MDELTSLAKAFDDRRERLRAVAFRLLGSASEADDAVQEAWLKLSHADAGEIDNLGGWLTTVVSRVCLDMLRARTARREEPADAAPALPAEGSAERELALADEVGPALLVVLGTLKPAERIAFVLHDLFDLSFDEVAAVLERTPASARQLAHRARLRVKGPAASPPALNRHQALVSAFLAASRDGDFARLFAVLSPEIVLRADALAVRTAAANPGAPRLATEVRGAAKIAEVFRGRARGAALARIDGAPGAVWAMGDQVRSAFLFTIEADRIARIELVMDPARLAAMTVERSP